MFAKEEKRNGWKVRNVKNTLRKSQLWDIKSKLAQIVAFLSHNYETVSQIYFKKLVHKFNIFNYEVLSPHFGFLIKNFKVINNY